VSPIIFIDDIDDIDDKISSFNLMVHLFFGISNRSVYILSLPRHSSDIAERLCIF
jgi:hypothetical protein